MKTLKNKQTNKEQGNSQIYPNTTPNSTVGFVNGEKG